MSHFMYNNVIQFFLEKKLFLSLQDVNAKLSFHNIKIKHRQRISRLNFRQFKSSWGRIFNHEIFQISFQTKILTNRQIIHYLPVHTGPEVVNKQKGKIKELKKIWRKKLINVSFLGVLSQQDEKAFTLLHIPVLTIMSRFLWGFWRYANQLFKFKFDHFVPVCSGTTASYT